MRKLKLQMQVTVDGFVAGPNGELDWMNYNLIDEYNLFINPKVIDKGMRIFKEDNKLNLQLINSRPFHCGTVVLSYETEKN